jgi:hypothetical protein
VGGGGDHHYELPGVQAQETPAACRVLALAHLFRTTASRRIRHGSMSSQHSAERWNVY